MTDLAKEIDLLIKSRRSFDIRHTTINEDKLVILIYEGWVYKYYWETEKFKEKQFKIE